LAIVVAISCAGGQKPTATTPATPPGEPVPAQVSTCDEHQTAILHEADTRAAPWSIAQHLTKNFPDGKVAWLMTDASYQAYVVKTAATDWGRCDPTGCYVFAAPSAVIHAAVEQSMAAGQHDPAALGKALGLPASNFEGPLRLMTFDTSKVAACVRLPIDADPGVWKCQTPQDTDCFKFGGYTSGGVPEVMVINAAVARTTIEQVP
jgi:hypothetical protein